MEFPPQPIDFRKELNDDQYAAVSSPVEPALVIAGAGSGKTRTLTYRVAWLLERAQFKPWEMLLLTFTNKAANEMLERVEALTGHPKRQFWGGTFHSIGQRFLRRHAEAAGLKPSYTILDEKDAESLLSDVVKQINPAYAKNKEHPKASVLFDIFSYARNTRKTLEEVIAERHPHLQPIAEELREFFDAYPRKKRELSVVDFDDLLELWYNLLAEHPDILAKYRAQFRAVLVDEYQDTNRLQSDIVDLLAGDTHRLMAVGDDAQCIYTWRGADFENVATFSTRHPNAKIYKIETNYRSTPEILNFANEIMRNRAAGTGFSKELRSQRDPGGLPIVGATLDGMKQADAIIRRIGDILEAGVYSASDIAVLYRAHFQAMDLQMELSRRGIPFTITSGVRFFEQSHIRDFTAQLRFLRNPADTTAFARVVSLLPGVGPATAARLLKRAHDIAAKKSVSVAAALTDDAVLSRLPKDAKDDFNDFALTLQNMEEALGAGAPNASTPAALPQKKKLPPSPWTQGSLFQEEAAPADAPSPAPAPAAPQTRVDCTPAEIVRIGVEGWYGDYLRNLHANWQSRRDDLAGLAEFAARFDTLDELLTQLSLFNSESGDKAPEPDAEKVRLTTVHQAKGLEFPIVFVIGLAEELFPLQRAVEEDTVEEERRLFYVACTRAKDQLYLLYPRLMMRNGELKSYEPSRFLREIDPSLFYFAR